MSSGNQTSADCYVPDLYPVDEMGSGSLPSGEDYEFHDFINDSFLARSPLTSISQPAESCISTQLVPIPQMTSECFPVPEKLAALQDFGLRSSPASTNKRKRRYSSAGDLAHVPCKVSWDTDSSGDSETQRIQAERPSSPIQLPIKRVSSSNLACTLMPFSLVKAFPSQNSLSLSDINRRIQTVAEGDNGLVFQSQSSVSSSVPINSLSARSPYRPQITVVHNYSSSMPEGTSLHRQSFASQCEFP